MNKFGWMLVFGVLFSVSIYAGFLLYLTWPVSQLSINKSGVFGDSFGLLTALFSGLAFAGLIITINMQKQELSLQRQELSLTRQELSGQREELKIQNATMIHQNFENTFFRMLSLHNDIVNGIDIKNGSKEVTGRDSFQALYNQFMQSSSGEEMKGSGLEKINENYLKFYEKKQHEIGHYFRNLYTIIKFVHESSIPNKKLYTNIVRAQLSSYELFFLFYNCLSEMGCEKFRPLIEEYALLKTFPDKLICNLENHKDLYKQGAYV